MVRSDPVATLSRRFPGRSAFITGGASGLGLALAEALARGGWRLGLFDLAAARLEAVAPQLRAAGAEVRTWAGDVADEAAVCAAIGQFAQQSPGLDLLVNNAGVAVAGGIAATSARDWRWIVDINLLGVVHGCRAAAPLMRARRSGLILNVASSAGFAAMPQMAAYNVTKAGVVTLSESIAAELADDGVQVTVAMPGFFRTNLLDSMRAPDAEQTLARHFMDISGQDPAAAARALLAAAARGRLYVVWPPEYRLAWGFKRWFPNLFQAAVRHYRRTRLAAPGRSADPGP